MSTSQHLADHHNGSPAICPPRVAHGVYVEESQHPTFQPTLRCQQEASGSGFVQPAAMRNSENRSLRDDSPPLKQYYQNEQQRPLSKSSPLNQSQQLDWPCSGVIDVAPKSREVDPTMPILSRPPSLGHVPTVESGLYYIDRQNPGLAETSANSEPKAKPSDKGEKSYAPIAEGKMSTCQMACAAVQGGDLSRAITLAETHFKEAPIPNELLVSILELAAAKGPTEYVVSRLVRCNARHCALRFGTVLHWCGDVQQLGQRVCLEPHHFFNLAERFLSLEAFCPTAVRLLLNTVLDCGQPTVPVEEPTGNERAGMDISTIAAAGNSDDAAMENEEEDEDDDVPDEEEVPAVLEFRSRHWPAGIDCRGRFERTDKYQAWSRDRATYVSESWVAFWFAFSRMRRGWWIGHSFGKTAGVVAHCPGGSNRRRPPDTGWQCVGQNGVWVKVNDAGFALPNAPLEMPVSCSDPLKRLYGLVNVTEDARAYFGHSAVILLLETVADVARCRERLERFFATGAASSSMERYSIVSIANTDSTERVRVTFAMEPTGLSKLQRRRSLRCGDSVVASRDGGTTVEGTVVDGKSQNGEHLCLDITLSKPEKSSCFDSREDWRICLGPNRAAFCQQRDALVSCCQHPLGKKDDAWTIRRLILETPLPNCDAPIVMGRTSRASIGHATVFMQPKLSAEPNTTLPGTMTKTSTVPDFQRSSMAEEDQVSIAQSAVNINNGAPVEAAVASKMCGSADVNNVFGMEKGIPTTVLSAASLELTVEPANASDSNSDVRLDYKSGVDESPAASHSPSPLKKLLVLCDMNRTLLFRANDVIQHTRQRRQPDAFSNRRFYYFREHAHQVVSTLTKSPQVAFAFYTSMTYRNAFPAAELLAPRSNIYDREFNTQEADEELQRNSWDTVRDLHKVWSAKFGVAKTEGPFDVTNTLMIDDSPRKMRFWPDNVVIVQEYGMEEVISGMDDALLQLQSWLKKLLDDVSAGKVYDVRQAVRALRQQALFAPALQPRSQLDILSDVRSDLRNRELTPAQRRAILMACTHSCTLVCGPPGTGKTSVACSILRHWAQTLRFHPILASGNSRLDVDNLAIALSQAGVRVVRVGHPEKITPNLEGIMLDTLVARRRLIDIERRAAAEAAATAKAAMSIRAGIAHLSRDEKVLHRAALAAKAGDDSASILELSRSTRQVRTVVELRGSPRGELNGEWLQCNDERSLDGGPVPRPSYWRYAVEPPVAATVRGTVSMNDHSSTNVHVNGGGSVCNAATLNEENQRWSEKQTPHTHDSHRHQAQGTVAIAVDPDVAQKQQSRLATSTLESPCASFHVIGERDEALPPLSNGQICAMGCCGVNSANVSSQTCGENAFQRAAEPQPQKRRLHVFYGEFGNKKGWWIGRHRSEHRRTLAFSPLFDATPAATGWSMDIRDGSVREMCEASFGVPRESDADIDEDIIALELSSAPRKLDHRLEDDDPLRHRVLFDAEVVCCTGTSVSNPTVRALGTFAAVFYDEAPQATELATLAATSGEFGFSLRRLVLCGDDRQLRPSALSPEAEKRGATVSLFERLRDTVEDDVEDPKSHLASCFLDKQFRAHPALFQFPSHHFYNGKLGSSVEPDTKPPIRNLPWPRAALPIAFFQMGGRLATEVRMGVESYINELEARKVVDLAALAITGGTSPRDIGIVAPYMAQVRILRDLFRARVAQQPRLRKRFGDGPLLISSVEAYQRREKELVIFSATRCNGHGDVGILSDARRLNVLLTHPRRGLVVVGSARTLRHDPNWQQWLEWCERRSLVVDSCSWQAKLTSASRRGTPATRHMLNKLARVAPDGAPVALSTFRLFAKAKLGIRRAEADELWRVVEDTDDRPHTTLRTSRRPRSVEAESETVIHPSKKCKVSICAADGLSL